MTIRDSTHRDQVYENRQADVHGDHVCVCICNTDVHIQYTLYIITYNKYILKEYATKC